MTNQEKAQEIADMYFLNEDIPLNMTAEECHISCKNAAIDMAEWKDKEFKEYLDKLSKKYLDDAEAALNNHDENNCEFLNGKVNVLYQILHELF